jgi:hypothetical protein
VGTQVEADAQLGRIEDAVLALMSKQAFLMSGEAPDKTARAQRYIRATAVQPSQYFGYSVWIDSHVYMFGRGLIPLGF